MSGLEGLIKQKLYREGEVIYPSWMHEEIAKIYSDKQKYNYRISAEDGSITLFLTPAYKKKLKRLWE